MTDLPPDRHPEPSDLQRCAEGEIDLERDAELVAHVEACAGCRAEVQAMRRVTALLCLSSAPPAELFERSKARRDAGERVPVGPVALVAEQPAATSTRTPAAATRPASASRPWHKRRTWHWVVGPLSAAAAVLLVARIAFENERPGDDPGRVRGGGAEDSATVRDSVAGDSVRVTSPDSARATGGTAVGSLVSLRRTPDGLVIHLAAASTSLDTQQVQALDSIVSVLRRDSTRRAVIRYVDPAFNRESDSWRLAVRATDHFTLRGIDPARVRSVRVQAVNKAELPPYLDAIEVVVNWPRADDKLP